MTTDCERDFGVSSGLICCSGSSVVNRVLKITAAEYFASFLLLNQQSRDEFLVLAEIDSRNIFFFHVGSPHRFKPSRLGPDNFLTDFLQ